MKKIYSKVVSTIVQSVMSFTIISNNIMIPNFKRTNDVSSYRTEYTLYGDLDGDKEINSFDMVLMRKMISRGDYLEKADLNYDKKLDINDLQILRKYLMSDSKIIDAYLYDDDDKDGICDMVEVLHLKTNPDSSDTDLDGLSDYEEVLFTRTSPTDKYSRDKKVSDDLDDPDGDKLTNKDEIIYKTNPLIKDSDFDGISDYDEIKIYNTDPNAEDSDGDGLIDGDEILLGLSPNQDKSNGLINDKCRTFEHIIPYENKLLADINNNDSPYEVSIDITSAGNFEKELSAKSISLKNDSINDGVIGKSINLSYNEKFSVDNAKLNFKLKNSEENIEDYMIFEFFPETNYLLPVETKYTEDSAYVETDKLGIFSLVKINSELQIDNIGNNNTGTTNIVNDYELGDVEVAFIIDVSSSIENNLEETKQSIHDCCQALFEHSNNATVQVVGYYISKDQKTIFMNNYKDSKGNPFLKNADSVDQALSYVKKYTSEKTTADADNNINGAIFGLDNVKDNIFSPDTHKFAFIMCDSIYSFNDKNQYKLDIPSTVRNSLKSIYESGIQLDFLLSNKCFDNKEAINNLQDVCYRYNFGVLKKADTGYFGDTEFSNIYDYAVIKKTTQNIYLTNSTNPNVIPSKINKNAFINSLPPSIDPSSVPEADSNGEIDFSEAAVQTGAAHYDENGDVVFKNYKEACYEDDLTRHGYDQLILKYDIKTRMIVGKIQIIPFTDKILYADNDGDGLANKDDPYPDEPFDDRFEIVDNYNYEPSIDFVEEHYINSQKCYNSFSPLELSFKTPNAIGSLINIIFTVFNESELLADILEPFICKYPMNFGLYPERASEQSDISRACDALNHYFERSGKEVAYSESDTCELISSSIANLTHLLDNLNSTMRCAEGILINDKTIIICPKSDANLKAICFTGTKSKDKTDRNLVECNVNIQNTGLRFHNFNEYCNYVHREWQLTVGEAPGTIIAKIKRNNNSYSMQYRYYFKDIYEWAYHYDEDPSDISAILHSAHESGLAQEYLMKGYFEGWLTWNLNDKITDISVASQIFKTLAEHEDGLGNNPSHKWTSSNEIDRFMDILSIGE